MDNRIKLDSDDTISANLKLTGDVSLASGVETAIEKLNGIPANTWVKSGVDVDTKQEQKLNQFFGIGKFVQESNKITQLFWILCVPIEIDRILTFSIIW